MFTVTGTPFISKLTPETSPAGDVAGSIVIQDQTRVGKTGSRDGVREGDRSRQLDQSNVVTGEGRHLGGRKHI